MVNAMSGESNGFPKMYSCVIPAVYGDSVS